MAVASYQICLFLFAVFITVPKEITCWDFEAVDLPNDVFIPRFSIWRNRAFLAVPRYRIKCSILTKSFRTQRKSNRDVHTKMAEK